MSAATINVHVSDDGALATLTAGGCVTIENSGELRLAFMDALERAARVALDLRRLEEVDITAAQVICSACKTAAVSGRCLVSEGGLPECVIGLGKGIGATMGLLCKQNKNEPCNWFGGAK